MTELKNNQNNKRAVLYVRVSTLEQVDEGNSLITQEKACRDWAEKNGYDVAAVFIERGESAKTANRTELQKMLRYCAEKKNRISAVIVYKLDRLSRNTDDYSQLRLLLKRYNIEIKSTSEFFENSPAGRFMENIIANVAQFDNDVRAERCSNGMREAVREGRYVWTAPIGYSNVRIAEKATIAPNDMAPLVHRGFQLVATSKYPTDEVWKILCKEGLVKKNGKPPARNYFYQMLRNRLFTARIEKFGEVHKGLFKAIVDDELFDQVQRVLKNKGHKVSPYKTDNPDFPLRRFVFHPSALKLTGSMAKGKYPSYRFNGLSGNYERNELHRNFAFLMDSYSFEDTQIEKLKRLVREEFHIATEEERTRAKRLEIRIKELEEQQTSLIKKNLKGVLSDSILKQQLDLVEKEIIDTHAILTTMKNVDISPEEAVAFSEEYLRSPSKVWERASFPTQIKLQWFQFPAGVIFDGKKFGTTEVSSVFKAKELILTPLSIRVDPRGFEPPASSVQMRRSSQMSYGPNMEYPNTIT